MPRTNWWFYFEGIGETHNGEPDDVNMCALRCLEVLEKLPRNAIHQARFSTSRGEENWLDGATREMHEDLRESAAPLAKSIPVPPLPSPHEELVEMGAKAKVKPKEEVRGKY